MRVKAFRMSFYYPGLDELLKSLHREKMLRLLSELDMYIDRIYKEFDIKAEKALGDRYSGKGYGLECCIGCASRLSAFPDDIDEYCRPWLQDVLPPLVIIEPITETKDTFICTDNGGLSSRPGIYLPASMFGADDEIIYPEESAGCTALRCCSNEQIEVFMADYHTRLEMKKSMKHRIIKERQHRKFRNFIWKSSFAVLILIVCTGYIFQPERVLYRRLKNALYDGKPDEAETYLVKLAQIKKAGGGYSERFHEVSALVEQEIIDSLQRFGRNREAFALADAWETRGFPNHHNIRKAGGHSLVAGLLALNEIEEAVDLMYRLIGRYPDDRHVLDFIARQSRQARHSDAIYPAMEAALRLARLSDSELSPWHGDALFAALERVDPDIHGVEIRDILVHRWSRARDRARLALNSDRVILRENAVRMLEEMGDITDLELLRHHLYIILHIEPRERIISEILDNSLKFVSVESAEKDWQQRKQAAGINIPEEIPVLRPGNSAGQRIRDIYVQAFGEDIALVP